MVQAWTITGRPKDKSTSFSPGPGQYTSRNETVDKLKAPQWTIGTSQREAFKTRALSPGPGMYQTVKDNNDAPKYHFGTKSVSDLDKFKKSVPGPGQYNPVSNAFNQTAFSFGGRHELKNKDLLGKPGPGAYSTKSTLSHTMGKIGTAKKGMPLVSKLILSNPGPGQYADSNNETLKRAAPKYRFGSSKRGDEGITKIKAMIPGPGQYAFAPKVGAEAPKYSLTARRPDTSPTVGKYSPGPGNYNPSDNYAKNQAPKYRFGSSTRKDLRKTFSPSPDAYNVTTLDSRKKSSPAFGFGSSNRQALSKTSLAPGPGNYSIPSKIVEKNGYYMGCRLSQKDRNIVPGPGNYDPDDKVGKTHSPTYKIGSSPRGANNKYKESIPGPGNYQYYNPALDKGPKVKFGNEKRGINVKSDTPGPGAYKIPVKIVDVPRYLIPNPDERFKFV